MVLRMLPVRLQRLTIGMAVRRNAEAVYISVQCLACAINSIPRESSSSPALLKSRKSLYTNTRNIRRKLRLRESVRPVTNATSTAKRLSKRRLNSGASNRKRGETGSDCGARNAGIEAIHADGSLGLG